MAEMKNESKNVVGNPKERENFIDLGIGRRFILERTLSKLV
jgi:hypothetical protein